MKNIDNKVRGRKPIVMKFQILFLQVFDDFSGERYAQLGAIEKAVAIFSLIVLVMMFYLSSKHD